MKQFKVKIRKIIASIWESNVIVDANNAAEAKKKAESGMYHMEGGVEIVSEQPVKSEVISVERYGRS